MQISECSVRARCSFASLARVPARFEDDEEPEEEEGEDLMDTMEKDYQYIPELDQSRSLLGVNVIWIQSRRSSSTSMSPF